MFLRYRVVEDHEYHRSSAIKNLSSMYRLEDKGLWNRGDDAIDRLEAQAHNQPKGRAGLRFQQRMTGKVSDLNKEQSELYLERDDSRMEIDVQVEGMATIVDSEVADEANPGKLTGTLGASAEASAQRRLNKEIARREKDSIRSERQSAKLAAKEAKAAAKAEKAAAKAAAKAEKAAAKAAKKSGGREATQAMWDAPPDNQWETPVPSSLAESVISCQECGAVNSSGTAYCSSCGTFL